MSPVLDAPRFKEPLLCSGRTGVGDDASLVVEKLSHARNLRHRTASSPDVSAEIAACYADHALSNWDGEGACGIELGAMFEALRFVEDLPESLPVPEVLPEPDGGLALEWYGAPNLVFIASFKGKGTVVYAGMFGQGNLLRGTEVLRGAVPEAVVDHIRRVGEFRKERT